MNLFLHLVSNDSGARTNLKVRRGKSGGGAPIRLKAPEKNFLSCLSTFRL